MTISVLSFCHNLTYSIGIMLWNQNSRCRHPNRALVQRSIVKGEYMNIWLDNVGNVCVCVCQCSMYWRPFGMPSNEIRWFVKHFDLRLAGKLGRLSEKSLRFLSLSGKTWSSVDSLLRWSIQWVICMKSEHPPNLCPVLNKSKPQIVLVNLEIPSTSSKSRQLWLLWRCSHWLGSTISRFKKQLN